MKSLLNLFVLLAASAVGAAPLALEDILKSTLTQNGQIQEAAADIEIARAQLDQARAALFPKASAMVLAAPIFEERGTAVASTSNWKKWGPFITGGLQVVQPLYTFGMISSYRRAAENQIVAREELTEAKRLEILSMAKEFYYGYRMAQDLDDLVGELVTFLEEALTTAEQNVKAKKKSAPKPHELFKLKTALEDLRQKKLLAVQGKQTAQKAIYWISGLKEGDIRRGAMTAEPFNKKTLDDYLKIARQKRPEFKALVAGQEARLALSEAKRSQSYPILFAGAFLSQGWSPVRDKQNSAFANDPFNQTQGGAGIGLKFDLEFARHAAEAAQENAEYLKLKATETYAAPGIELQVRKAFWEVEQATQGLEIAKRRKDLGKKWFLSSAMGWSIGLTAAKDLLEALEGDGLARKNYIETVYAANMAFTHLSQAIGDEVTSLKYR